MNNKLNNPNTAPKNILANIKPFLYIKKIPTIPPLLINGKFASDFCTKANLFNDCFASIRTSINNGSSLPPFAYKTNERQWFS